MHRTLNATAAAALLAASTVAVAEINTCDIEVTRTRVDEEKVCYAQFGPQSGNWIPGSTPELDACLDDVQGRFKVKRWLCHGVTFSGVDYEQYK